MYAYLGRTGSADDPAPKGNGTSADAGMVKYQAIIYTQECSVLSIATFGLATEVDA